MRAALWLKVILPRTPHMVHNDKRHRHLAGTRELSESGLHVYGVCVIRLLERKVRRADLPAGGTFVRDDSDVPILDPIPQNTSAGPTKPGLSTCPAGDHRCASDARAGRHLMRAPTVTDLCGPGKFSFRQRHERLYPTRGAEPPADQCGMPVWLAHSRRELLR